MSTVTPLARRDIKRLVSGEIRAEMARQGITQAALAKHLNFNQSQLSKRLRGQITLNIEELQQIADFLGVRIDVLFGFSGPPEGPGTNGQLPRLDSNQEPFGSLSPQVRALLRVA